jgi:formylmethanofuran dehydrogenase subunit E
MDAMYREHERKKRMEKARQLALKEIEEVLGEYVNLPPRENWEIETLDNHILVQNKGWLDLCLRVKIDDLEFWVGVSLSEKAIIMIRGRCEACQEYLYYAINLDQLEFMGLKYLLEMIDIASKGVHLGSRCFAKRKE